MIHFEENNLWINELEIALYALDDIRTDCTGMTLLISSLLKRDAVEHRCMHGSVNHKPSLSHVTPHYWIELGQDIGKGPANTRGPALAQSRRYAVAVGGSQMCGSSWSMSRALWVGSRVSTSFRYA